MKSSIVLLGLSTLLASEVFAQKNAPDALNYEFPEKKLRKFQLADSALKQWGSIGIDSLRKLLPLDQGNIMDMRGSAKGMVPGTLLDNGNGISEDDGYIQGGQKYYIRNFRPLIEPKEVSPGIYHCK